MSLDTVAEWVDDLTLTRRVWDLYRKGSPPGAGYELGNFWTSPADPNCTSCG